MQDIINRIVNDVGRRPERGTVASYIPQLAGVDPRHFAISVVTVDGRVYNGGDADTPFSIQSISKVFTLTQALGRLGDGLWQHVGREPSGDPFNSIVQLEHEHGKPRNPFINAGAIAVADALLMGVQCKEMLADLLRFVRYLADDDAVFIDKAVANSELATGDRNASLAHFMAGFRHLRNPVDSVLNAYFHQCAIAMTSQQLARAGLFLACDGVDPVFDSRVVPATRARRVNSLMLMCGHYDGSGEFAYRVGLPGKSGVGGGILAIAPGQAAVAVWSPGLDTIGNSKLGTEALAALVEYTGWSVFV